MDNSDALSRSRCRERRLNNKDLLSRAAASGVVTVGLTFTYYLRKIDDNEVVVTVQMLWLINVFASDK